MNQSDCNFFDSLAPCWDAMIRVDPAKIGHILDVAGVGTGMSILDVGTGTGVLVPYLTERVGPAGHVDAVDISEGMLKEARKKFGLIDNVCFLQADVEEETLPDEYDCIMMYCMLPHLMRPLDTLEWLSKVNLRSGGRIVVAFPESRESINSIPSHNDGSVHSHHLPEGAEMKCHLVARGVNVDYVEDSEDYYIVRITKP